MDVPQQALGWKDLLAICDMTILYERFCQFHHRLPMGKFYHANSLSYINHYIEDVVTFTALVKTCFTKINISVIQT